MQQVFFEIEVPMSGKSRNDISNLVQKEVEGRDFGSGLLTLWCLHTGAFLLVQANADEDVAADILAFFESVVPKQVGKYRHKPDDLDNAPSHIRAWLTRKWKVSQSGNRYLKTDGFHIVVFPITGRWSGTITRLSTETATQARRLYDTQDKAKLGAFDGMIWLKTH